jgi:hypothetical protein
MRAQLTAWGVPPSISEGRRKRRMTITIDVLGAIFIVSYLSALVYGYCHADDPFWNGFIDPFRVGQRDGI